MSVNRIHPTDIRKIAAAVLWFPQLSPAFLERQYAETITTLTITTLDDGYPDPFGFVLPVIEGHATYADAHLYTCRCLNRLNLQAFTARYGIADDVDPSEFARGKYHGGWNPGRPLTIRQAKQVLGDWTLGAGFMYQSDLGNERSRRVQAVIHAAAFRVLAEDERIRNGDGIYPQGVDFLADYKC